MEKALWAQWNIPPWLIASMEKTWFYEILFFEVVTVMVKDKKYSIKDAMSIKISFIHCLKWARVMLLVVFKDLEEVYIFFCYFFLFTIHFD